MIYIADNEYHTIAKDASDHNNEAKDCKALTLKVSANELFATSSCCRAAAVCSLIPFLNTFPTCSDIVLQECSNAGTTDDSKQDLKASCIQVRDTSRQNKKDSADR